MEAKTLNKGQTIITTLLTPNLFVTCTALDDENATTSITLHHHSTPFWGDTLSKNNREIQIENDVFKTGSKFTFIEINNRYCIFFDGTIVDGGQEYNIVNCLLVSSQSSSVG